VQRGECMGRNVCQPAPLIPSPYHVSGPFRYNPNPIHEPERRRAAAQVNPNIRKDKWTEVEDRALMRLVKTYGCAWAEISRLMDGRTDQQCMGRWRRHLDPAIRRDAWTAREDGTLQARPRAARMLGRGPVLADAAARGCSVLNRPCTSCRHCCREPDKRGLRSRINACTGCAKRLCGSGPRRRAPGPHVVGARWVRCVAACGLQAAPTHSEPGVLCAALGP
jgi:hypothetical protein